MKILFVLNDYNAGFGSEVIVSNILNSLAEKTDNEYYLLSIFKSEKVPRYLHPSIHLDYLLESSPSERFEIPEYYKSKYKESGSRLKSHEFYFQEWIDDFIKQNKINLVVFHNNIFLDRKLSCKMIREFHSPYFSWKDIMTYDHVKLYDGIISLSDKSSDYWSQFKVKTYTIPNFTKLKGERSRVSRIILSLGRLSPEKGYDKLLDAWSKIGDHKDFKLHIHGSGPMLEELKSRNVPDVEFLPYVSDPSILYSDAYAYVQPSEYEGFSMTCLEATRFNLPIVAFDVFESDFLVHGANALLSEYPNTDEMANCLTLLMSDPCIAKSIGEAKPYGSKYDEDEIIKLWINLFEDQK